MNSSELDDDVVGRALRQLPAPRAPRTLLPRVLLAAHRQPPRPWHQRAWHTWPRRWQLASATVCAALLGALLWAGLQVGTLASPWGGLLPRPLDGVFWVGGVAGQAEAVANASRVVWLATLGPVSSYVLASVSLMTVACTLIAAVLERMLQGRVFET